MGGANEIRDAMGAAGTVPIGKRALSIQGIAGGTPIPVSVGGGTPNASTIATNQKNVAVSGTAVQLQAQLINPGDSVTIKAKAGNTGVIRIGKDAATAQSATLSFTLAAGEAIELGVDNVDDIWIDASVSADGVQWIVEVT